MHGRERNKTSAPNSPGQTADVDKGSSFLLLELRMMVKGAFGNGVAQLQLRERARGSGNVERHRFE